MSEWNAALLAAIEALEPDTRPQPETQWVTDERYKHDPILQKRFDATRRAQWMHAQARIKQLMRAEVQ